MPERQGDVGAEAIALADAELRRAGRAGSIVLISDGLGADLVTAIEAMEFVPVHVLAMGAPSELAAARRLLRTSSRSNPWPVRLAAAC